MMKITRGLNKLAKGYITCNQCYLTSTLKFLTTDKMFQWNNNVFCLCIIQHHIHTSTCLEVLITQHHIHTSTCLEALNYPTPRLLNSVIHHTVFIPVFPLVQGWWLWYWKSHPIPAFRRVLTSCYDDFRCVGGTTGWWCWTGDPWDHTISRLRRCKPHVSFHTDSDHGACHCECNVYKTKQWYYNKWSLSLVMRFLFVLRRHFQLCL